LAQAGRALGPRAVELIEGPPTAISSTQDGRQNAGRRSRPSKPGAAAPNPLPVCLPRRRAGSPVRPECQLPARAPVFSGLGFLGFGIRSFGVGGWVGRGLAGTPRVSVRVKGRLGSRGGGGIGVDRGGGLIGVAYQGGRCQGERKSNSGKKATSNRRRCGEQAGRACRCQPSQAKSSQGE
jgi:hypothetical protein